MSDTSESGWDCWVVRSGEKPEQIELDDGYWTKDYNAESAAESAAEHAYDSRDGWEWMPDSGCDVWVQKRGTRDEPLVYRIKVEFEPTFYSSRKEA